jgi:hypothetical protein
MSLLIYMSCKFIVATTKLEVPTQHMFDFANKYPHNTLTYLTFVYSFDDSVLMAIMNGQ